MMTGSPWSTSTGAPSSGTVAAIRRTGTCFPARFISGSVWYGDVPGGRVTGGGCVPPWARRWLTSL